MMVEQTALEAEKQPMVSAELGATVSDRVQIEDVILTKCSASRGPDTSPDGDTFTIKLDLKRYGISRESEEGKLFVFLDFELEGLKEGENTETSRLTVEATFAVVYRLDSFDGLSDQNLQAFARYNGVYNAWPYWREFVRNTTVRMGLPPLTIPVYRIRSTSK